MYTITKLLLSDNVLTVAPGAALWQSQKEPTQIPAVKTGLTRIDAGRGSSPLGLGRDKFSRGQYCNTAPGVN